jgi:hypothetical protein
MDGSVPDGATVLGGVEGPAQLLLRLADALARHGAEIHLHQVDPELVRDHLRGQRLAGAARTGEQRRGPQPAAVPVGSSGV